MALAGELDFALSLSKTPRRCFNSPGAVSSVQSVQCYRLSLPKFSTETTFDLREALMKLGIRTAFTQGKVDFLGMFHRPAFIEKAVHQSTIMVDEKGTVAIAATALKYMPYNRGPLSTRFVVDHPFLFILKVKDHAVFVGQVHDLK